MPGPPLRFMPLWNKFSSEFIDIIQGAARASFRQHKICWIRGLSYTLLAKAMVGIHTGVHIHLLNVLGYLKDSNAAAHSVDTGIS